MKRKQRYENLLQPTRTDPDLARMLYLAVSALYQLTDKYPQISKAARTDLYEAVEWNYLQTRNEVTS
jgi:hypothetical protein